MFAQLSPSPPHLHTGSLVHTALFLLHENLREHFEFSQLHLTSCSPETGAGEPSEKEPILAFGLGSSTPRSDGQDKWGFIPHPGSYISLTMSTAHMFNPCSMVRWQLVNSLFISELLEEKTPAHLCFPNADRNESMLPYASLLYVARILYCTSSGVIAFDLSLNM